MLKAMLYINDRNITEIYIHNKGTGTHLLGDYDVTWLEPKCDPVRFCVCGFQRKRGAAALVQRAIATHKRLFPGRKYPL